MNESQSQEVISEGCFFSQQRAIISIIFILLALRSILYELSTVHVLIYTIISYHYWNKNLMSSTVSLAIDPASPPTVPSNTSFFFSWSFNIRSSMVFSVRGVVVVVVAGEIKVKIKVS